MQYAVKAKSQYLRGLDPVYTYRQDLRILSDEVFERNQNISEARKRIPACTKGSPHLFSGVIRCPYCGGTMSGKQQVRHQKSKDIFKFSYQCADYQRSGSSVCVGYWIPEREVVKVMLPILTEFIQEDLCEHFQSVTKVSPLNEKLEGEIKAEITKVTKAMKNLLDAVKEGALSFEQVSEENADLQESKRRLEKRLHDLHNSTQLESELRE